jgi:hypothetical protein
MNTSRASFLPAVALATLLASATFTASAAPLSFLNDTLTARFPAKDLPALRSAIAGALNNSPNGSTTQWEGQQGAPHRHFKVALTPLQTTQTEKVGTCRLLDLQVSQGQRMEPWQFWFCQQQNGNWKASGTETPH